MCNINHKAWISQSVSAFSFISTGYVFYKSVKFQYQKICVTSCIKGHHKKSIKNKKICQRTFVPYSFCMFWRNFTETIWFYITLLIHLKRGGSLKKQVRVFAFQRFINMGICQLKELLASEITEPLAFTVGKLEFPGKL